MIGVPTGTVVPSGTSSAVTSPANGLGSSTTDFAVSMSTIVWLTSTTSPTATCHVSTSASVSPSPTSGSLNSLISSSPQNAIARSTASSTRSRSGRNSSSTRLGG